MRLIDADALTVELMDSDLDHLQRDDWKEVFQIVADAPTIKGHKWIPCSEGLPERSGNYLITRDIIEGYEKEACSIDYFEADTLCWDGYDNLVIAWMPLPEAYKKE